MSDPFDPREALRAVQRLESDLDDVRARARRAAHPDLTRLRDELMTELARQRASTIDDLSAVIDVVEAVWRAQQRGHDTLRADIHRLDARFDDVQSAIARLQTVLSSARVEVRFDAPTPEGTGASNGSHHRNGVSRAG